jgi:hypothetical protein
MFWPPLYYGDMGGTISVRPGNGCIYGYYDLYDGGLFLRWSMRGILGGCMIVRVDIGYYELGLLEWSSR